MRSAFPLAILCALAFGAGPHPVSHAAPAPQWTAGPPPEMSRVTGFAGTWQVQLRTPNGRTFAAPDRWVVEPILEGTTLRIEGTYPQVTARLVILLGYDRFNKMFRMAVADNQSAQLDIYEGSWEGEALSLTNLKTRTFITDPAGGPRQFVRLQMRGLETNAPTIATEVSIDDGTTWRPAGTLEFTRLPAAR